jgi:hypothetical protein
VAGTAYREGKMTIRTGFLPIAAALASAAVSTAAAHHAFITEFDPDLEGEVRGVVTRVWWMNPHVRYDVEVTLPDGAIEQWTLQPPGNIPTYRRQGWFADTISAGDQVRATGNLGRDGARRLYATCIHLEGGRQLGQCVEPGTVTEVTADPDVVYT